LAKRFMMVLQVSGFPGQSPARLEIEKITPAPI